MAVVTPTRDLVTSALDRIGHQGSPAFRKRLATALDAAAENAPVGTVVRSRVSDKSADARRWTSEELDELSRTLKHAFEQELVNRINLAVGELALTLEADDPRRAGLRTVQSGLDAVWSAIGGAR